MSIISVMDGKKINNFVNKLLKSNIGEKWVKGGEKRIINKEFEY